MNKKGRITKQTVIAIIILLVLLVVLFNVWAALVPEAQTAGSSLNDTNRCNDIGCSWNATNTTASCRNQSNSVNDTECSLANQTIPLSGLFTGTGVVFVIIMAALFLVTLIGVFAMLKGKK